MPHGGQLTIVTRNTQLDSEDYAQRVRRGGAGGDDAIEVSDSGSGMAPEVLLRIFEPFFTTKEPGVHGFWAVDGVRLHEAVGRSHQRLQ